MRSNSLRIVIRQGNGTSHRCKSGEDFGEEFSIFCSKTCVKLCEITVQQFLRNPALFDFEKELILP